MLRMQNITKQFPGVKALDNVTMEAREGRILALVGVNGAGKSTLMNVLGGVLKNDCGEILINGQAVEFSTPKDAEKHGIAFIHQEPLFFHSMSVAENIFISDLYKAKIPVFTDKKKANLKASELIHMMGTDISPKAKMQELSLGEIQVVEIARALAKGSDIVIFDEPTSSLSLNEKENLFRVIRQLKNEGKTVIYISHFLDEIFELCDDYLVLRDGKVTGSGLVADITKKDLVRMLIGQDLGRVSNSCYEAEGCAPVMRVEGIRSGNLLKGIDFELNKGEILGVWGLMGSGRTEMIRAILGLDRVDGGDVYLMQDGEFKKMRKKKMLKYCGYITESRHADGLFLDMPLWKNCSATNHKKYASKILKFMDMKKEIEDANRLIDALSIKTNTPQVLLKQLSGGNQQKVVFAKWMNRESRILIMDEPTRGVDVGAKLEIYNTIRELTRTGTSVILITSELDEMVDLADRVIILHDGIIAAEETGAGINNRNLMQIALEGSAVNE
jgi:ABC-type sugar transport system ATPase subunit